MTPSLIILFNSSFNIGISFPRIDARKATLVKRFNRKTPSAFLKFADPIKSSNLSLAKFTQSRHKRSASLLESLAKVKGRGLSFG